MVSELTYALGISQNPVKNFYIMVEFDLSRELQRF